VATPSTRAVPPGPIVPPGAGPVAENDLARLGGADLEPLFTSFSIGDLELRNRFVMAPMTRQYCPGGTPGPDVAAYYARRAPHVGLIVTEGTYIGHPSAGTSDRVPRFYGDEALAGWADVVAAVHAAGGRVVPQLWHLGAARSAGAPPHPTAPVISPSGIGADGRRSPGRIWRLSAARFHASVLASRLRGVRPHAGRLDQEHQRTARHRHRVSGPR
jgi:hypothetical protein